MSESASLAFGRPGHHGPCRLDRYEEIHETIMNRFRRDFVGDDTLDFVPVGPTLLLCGEIGCKGRIVIRVEKELEYIEDDSDAALPLVQTVMYSYAVSVQGRGVIFRYDNQHPEYLRPAHHDPHHRHEYDWPNPNEVDGSPFWIGAERWPTLNVVIEEARQWHAANYPRLDDPEGFPPRLQRGGVVRS